MSVENTCWRSWTSFAEHAQLRCFWWWISLCLHLPAESLPSDLTSQWSLRCSWCYSASVCCLGGLFSAHPGHTEPQGLNADISRAGRLLYPWRNCRHYPCSRTRDEHLLLSLPYPEPMTSGYWNLPAVLFPLWASSLLLKQDPNVAFATNGCLAWLCRL